MPQVFLPMFKSNINDNVYVDSQLQWLAKSVWFLYICLSCLILGGWIKVETRFNLRLYFLPSSRPCLSLIEHSDLAITFVLANIFPFNYWLRFGKGDDPKWTLSHSMDLFGEQKKDMSDSLCRKFEVGHHSNFTHMSTEDLGKNTRWIIWDSSPKPGDIYRKFSLNQNSDRCTWILQSWPWEGCLELSMTVWYFFQGTTNALQVSVISFSHLLQAGKNTHTHTHVYTREVVVPEVLQATIFYRFVYEPPIFFRLRVYKIIGEKWPCLKWWQRTSRVILNLACLKFQWSGFAISLFVRGFLTSPLKGSLRMMTPWPNSRFFVGEACRFNGQTFPGFPGFKIIWPDNICWKSTLPFF